MKLLRMMAGYGEAIVAEGDPRIGAERQRLGAAFRHQIDEGMWAAVPVAQAGTGRREAMLVSRFEDVPSNAERVLFWPRATGGAG